MSFKGLFFRYLLIYLTSLIVMAVIIYILGINGNRATNAGMLVFSLSVSLSWYSRRNVQYLTDVEMFSFALFAFLLDSCLQTLGAFIYYYSVGTVLTVSQSFATQFSKYGIFDLVLIFGYVFISKRTFVKTLGVAVKPSIQPIQTKELNWRRSTNTNEAQKTDDGSRTK